MTSLSRVLALTLFAVSAPMLRAQEPADSFGGTISGAVRDTRGDALPDADVIVLGRGVLARTNLRGEFRIAGLPAADVIVFVRHLGHAPVFFSVTPRRAESEPLTVALERAAQPLEMLEVSELRGTYAGLARRLATGESTILSSERLSAFPTLTAALEATLPGALSGTRGCVLEGVNGALPTALARAPNPAGNSGRDAVAEPAAYSAMGASTLNPRVIGTGAGGFDMWSTAAGGFSGGSNGLGHIDLGMTFGSTQTARVPTWRHTIRGNQPAPRDLLALELVPAEHAAEHFPGVRRGCAVVQLWL